MIRNDGFHIFFIEPDPSTKRAEPIRDEATLIVEEALRNAKKGIEITDNSGRFLEFREGGRYRQSEILERGMHNTGDGMISDNQDYLLCDGMFITNSLAAYYIAHYRHAITPHDAYAVQRMAYFQGKRNLTEIANLLSRTSSVEILRVVELSGARMKF